MRNDRLTSHRKITTCRLSPESDAYRQQLELLLTDDLLLQGLWRKEDAEDDEVMLNVLRCQLTY